MKTRMRTMTPSELKKVYGKSAIRCNENGYILRKVGKTKGQKNPGQKNPNLQIYVPGVGLPMKFGDVRPIDLLQGFTSMPEIVEAMNLIPDYEVGFLFCRDFHAEYDGRVKGNICCISLCDPEDAQYILIVTHLINFMDDADKDLCDSIDVIDGELIFYGNTWHDHSFESRLIGGQREYYERRSYSLVSIGFRNTPDGEAQTAEDMNRVKEEVIRLANEYLGIESEEPSVAPETQSVEGTSIEPSSKFVTPGLTSEGERLDSWVYYDDIGAEDCWVIDQYGHLLRPTIVEDYKDKFMEESIETAEHRIWENVPDTALVLSWSKPSISENHEFTVNREPDRVTPSQLERVATLEHNIEKAYAGKVSPYDQSKSPGIRGGWNLWQHGPLK